MKGGLPATIDPYLLAEKGAHLRGVLPVRQLRRLAELCLDDRGDVGIDLQFERSDAQGLCLMHGAVTATLHVACQRCLEAMALHLATEPRLVLRRPEPPTEEPTDEDETLVVDKAFALSELVENELLLAMPMVPMHNLAECPARSLVSGSGPSEGKRKAKTNPFSVLMQRNREKH